MDSITHFKRLFAFEEWAQRETLASLEALPATPEQARKLLAHQVAAGFLWLARIQGAPSPLPVWPDLDLAQCRTRLEELADSWRAYLAKLTYDELSRSVSYTNSLGEPWSSEVAAILSHVVLHGSHHRGQIASELRAAGQQPAYVDFIHGSRNSRF